MIKESILTINEDDSLATPSPFCTTIEPFRSIIRRDRGSEGDAQGRKKLFAAKEFAYIYGMVDYRSPYSSFNEENRAVKLKEVIFGEDSDWEPDELVKKAMVLYEEMYHSELVILLKSTRKALHNMSDFFETLDLTDTDDKGKLVHNPNTVMTSMSKIGDIAKQLDGLEELIEKQRQSQGKIRGDIKLNKYNQ